jgi:hypothetical protein
MTKAIAILILIFGALAGLAHGQSISMNGTVANLVDHSTRSCSVAEALAAANRADTRQLLQAAAVNLGGTYQVNTSRNGFQTTVNLRITQNGVSTTLQSVQNFFEVRISGMRGFPNASGVLVVSSPTGGQSSLTYSRLLIRQWDRELLTSEYAIDVKDRRFKLMTARFGDCLLRSSQAITKRFWSSVEAWSNNVLLNHSRSRSPLLSALREVYTTRGTSEMLLLPTALISNLNLEHAFTTPTLNSELAREFAIRPQDPMWLQQAKRLAKEVVEALVKKLKEYLAKILVSWIFG